MKEKCFYCFDPSSGRKLICQEPSIPLIPGRWEITPDGQRVNLNPEKMAECPRRIARLRDLEVMHQTGKVPSWVRRWKSDSF